MAEVYPIEEVLRQVKDFPPLQRILLSSPGTLQSTLSAYFAKPVKVEVRSQSEPETVALPFSVSRNVDLFIHEGEGTRKHPLVVCSASSEITMASWPVIDLVTKKEMGIGQIMEYRGIRPSFVLHEVGREEETFWRLYTLEGGSITYRIRETFPARLYQ